MSVLSSLEERLGLTFQNRSLLEQALTPALSEPIKNNERLEFIGDAVLDWVVTMHLDTLFPNDGPNRLSRMRTSLVCGATLCTIGEELGIPDLLQSKGFPFGDGSNKKTIVDAVEALIGAAYKDQGLKAAKSVIEKLLLSQQKRFLSAEESPSTILHNFLQNRKRERPEYRYHTVREGKLRATVFCKGEPLAFGFGSDQEKAKEDAARKALAKLSQG